MSSAGPPEPRPAATVMVVRRCVEDAQSATREPGLNRRSSGIEVYMVRRHQASRFAADVYVFPGGTIRSDDCVTDADAEAVGLQPKSLRAILANNEDSLVSSPDGGLALYVAALRELFEEAGILLAESEQGPLDLSEGALGGRIRELRDELQAGKLSLLELARSHGLRLLAQKLVYFSRWITPESSPLRYDARFLLAELPTGQTARYCQIETTDGLWISPEDALAREAGEDFPMMFVTSEHIRRLAEFRELPELLEFARSTQATVVRPVLDQQRRPHLTHEQRW